MSKLAEIARRKRAAAANARNERSTPSSESGGTFMEDPLTPSETNGILPPSSPSQTRSSSPTMDDGDLPPTSQLLTVSNLGTRVPNMTAFGERQLKRVKLSAASERDYRQLCAATNVHERQNLHALAVFQLIDKVDDLNASWKAAKGQDFEKNAELNADIRRFSRAALLNPDIQFYGADSTLKLDLIKAMYKENVPHLPPQNSSNAIKRKLEGIVGHQLSVDRAKIKEVVGNSLKVDRTAEDPPATDLASIATALMASWSIDLPLTLPMLWRLSLIRFQISECPATRDDFWKKLDQSLHETRKEGAGSLIMALQELFKLDVEAHGALAEDIDIDVDGIGPHSEAWLQRVDKLARKVENPKVVGGKGKTTAEPDASTASTRPHKRKRTNGDSEDEDVDEDGGTGGT